VMQILAGTRPDGAIASDLARANLSILQLPVTRTAGRSEQHVNNTDFIQKRNSHKSKNVQRGPSPMHIEQRLMSQNRLVTMYTCIQSEIMYKNLYISLIKFYQT